MEKSTAFHEEVFCEYFRPFRHRSASNNIWGGYGLETFGKDLELVRAHDPMSVWTVVDSGETNDQWIIPGVHHVNRVCYLLTEVAHNEAPIEFRVSNRPHSLTPLGLARRLTVLRKIMLSIQ